MTKDSTSTLVRSAVSFFSGTSLSRMTGLFREIAMAMAFGATAEVAAFLMAYRFAYLLRRIFGEGALNSAFVPHFESLRVENPQKGARFFYDLSIACTLCLLVFSILSEIALGAFFVFCDLSCANRQIVRLTMLMLPACVFISLYALNGALLNCEKKYFLPSSAPSLLNCIWVIAVFFLWKKPLYEAMEMLSMIIVFAYAAQWLVTMPHVYVFLKKELGKFWWKKSFSFTEIMCILKPFSLALIGVCATQINTILDAMFARIAESEGPAYLWFALRVQQLPLALFGLGLTGALLPPISRAFASKDMMQCKKFLSFGYTQTIVWMVPITFGAIALGFSGMNLLYGHGQFSELALKETTLCFWSYAIGLLPMTLVLIFASAFYAQKNYKTPAVLSCMSLALNTLLNALFVFEFHMGAVSVALSTTLAAFLNAFSLYFFLKKDLGSFFEGKVCLVKSLIAGILAAWGTIYFGHLFSQEATFGFLFNQCAVQFSHTLGPQLLCFSTQCVTFVVLFSLMACLLRIREFLELLSTRSR